MRKTRTQTPNQHPFPLVLVLKNLIKYIVLYIFVTFQYYYLIKQNNHSVRLYYVQSKTMHSGTREHTTHAKTNTIANSGPPKPSCRPTPTERAVTVAECDDGMPPDPISCFGSHRFSLYLDRYKRS